MIIRILEEGQFEVPDTAMNTLNTLDSALLDAIDSDDAAAFASGLTQLLTAVRQNGTQVADDYLGPSDLVLPREGAGLEEVKELLTEEGLIPD